MRNRRAITPVEVGRPKSGVEVTLALAELHPSIAAACSFPSAVRSLKARCSRAAQVLPSCLALVLLIFSCPSAPCTTPALSHGHYARPNRRLQPLPSYTLPRRTSGSGCGGDAPVRASSPEALTAPDLHDPKQQRPKRPQALVNGPGKCVSKAWFKVASAVGIALFSPLWILSESCIWIRPPN